MKTKIQIIIFCSIFCFLGSKLESQLIMEKFGAGISQSYLNVKNLSIKQNLIGCNLFYENRDIDMFGSIAGRWEFNYNYNFFKKQDSDINSIWNILLLFGKDLSNGGRFRLPFMIGGSYNKASGNVIINGPGLCGKLGARIFITEKIALNCEITYIKYWDKKIKYKNPAGSENLIKVSADVPVISVSIFF